MLYSKDVPLKHSVDVFIAGGGPAGIAAAIACARLGRRVFLAESFSAFGGAAVTMLVPAFMPFGDGVHFLAGGIGREVYDRLCAETPARFADYCPNSIPVEPLKRIYDDMMRQSGASFSFYTTVVDAVVADGRIEYVLCAAKSELFAVKARIYIDCTGDGELSFFAGAKSEYGDENGCTMAATLCALWSGIDWSGVHGADREKLEDAFRDGVFTNQDRHLPGMWRIMAQTGDGVPDGVGGSNAGHVYGVDPRSADSLTKGTLRGREQLVEYRRYYQTYLSGYVQAEPIFSAPYLGIREGRRIVCDYRLVLDDFLRRAVFEDEIGRYAYHIDIHSATNDAAGYEKYLTEHKGYRLQKGESYGIPYRSLTAAGLRNLLVAGRCICTDRYLQSSVRVMPGCFITGQAAGVAAAESCAHGDVHRVEVRAVQKKLLEMGAYLPNFTA